MPLSPIAMADLLVVDDDEAVRCFLSAVLEEEGHVVVTATDGLQALEQLRQRSFHVVLADLTMPQAWTACRCCKAIRRDYPETEVIVLTGYGSVESAVAAMKAGAFEFLEKPLASPAALTLVVDRAMERRRLRAVQEIAVVSSTPPLGYGAPAMLAVERALQKVAVTDATVLLMGESGTRQGDRRARGARLERPGPRALRGRQLRGAVDHAARERAVRAREGGLHGGPRPPARPHRAGRGRDLLPRRGGRAGAGPAGAPAARDPGEALRAGGWAAGGRRQRPLDRRHQPRPARHGGRGEVPRGPVPPHGGLPRDACRRCASGARTSARWPSACWPASPPRWGAPSSASPRRRKRTLAGWDWPGNVRELANVLERSAILAEEDEIRSEDLALFALVKPRADPRAARRGHPAAAAPHLPTSRPSPSARGFEVGRAGRARRARPHPGGARTLRRQPDPRRPAAGHLARHAGQPPHRIRIPPPPQARLCRRAAATKPPRREGRREAFRRDRLP